MDGEEGRGSFALGIRAVRLAELDARLPERRRLGMDQIAWLLGIDKDQLDSWWRAYQGGGVDALRSRVEEGRRRPDAGAGAPGDEEDGPPARGARSGAGEKAAGPGGETDWSRVCLACAIKSGLVRPVKWHFGSGRVPLPGRRGQRMDIGDMPPRPPQRRFPCKCRGDCRTEDDEKIRNCGCEPSRRCECPCCRPLTFPPIGPPHAPGCPAMEAARMPPHVIEPAHLHKAIKERSGIDYSPGQLRALMEALEMLPEDAPPNPGGPR